MALVGTKMTTNYFDPAVNAAAFGTASAAGGLSPGDCPPLEAMARVPERH